MNDRSIYGSTTLAPGERTLVVGVTGSGKTTMANAIAAARGYPCIELDALHWEADWQEAPYERLRQRVQTAVAQPQWVLDGNYSAVRDLTWPRADTVVWLNYPMRINYWRLLRRTFQRSFLQVELWNGNRERFAVQFLSRDSLFLWAKNTYARRRIDYRQTIQSLAWRHLRFIELRSPRAADEWLLEQI